MLTGHQTVVVAFDSEGGEIIHPECAVKKYGALATGKAELGLWNSGGLRPLIRYSLDELLSEREYDEADQRVSEFEHCHPAFDLSGDARSALVERTYERVRQDFYSCDVCGKGIS